MTSSNTSSAPTRSHSDAQSLEEARFGRDESHVGSDRLNDDACGALIERGHHVVRHDLCVGHRRLGHPSRPRQAQLGQPAACLGEQQVAVSVVVARELHDRVPSGEATRDAQRRHRRLGSRRHEPHHVDRRHPLDDGLGQQHLAFGRRTVGGAVDRGPLHRVHDRRVRMPGDDGAIGLHQVEVLAALDVPDAGTFGAVDEVGSATYPGEGSHRAVDPARDDPLRPPEQLSVAHGEMRPVRSARVARSLAK